MLTAVQKEQIEYISNIAGELQDAVRHDNVAPDDAEAIDTKMGDILSTCSKLLSGRDTED